MFDLVGRVKRFRRARSIEREVERSLRQTYPCESGAPKTELSKCFVEYIFKIGGINTPISSEDTTGSIQYLRGKHEVAFSILNVLGATAPDTFRQLMYEESVRNLESRAKLEEKRRSEIL